MSPRSIAQHALHHPEPLHASDTIEQAVRAVLAGELPALPVVDDRERYAGIFGEREFMAALFPGYLSQLKGASYLSRALDDALEKRESCRSEQIGKYMNTEHVDVDSDYGDTQLAEIFLHHRVLVVPVIDDGNVSGIITRRDFFRQLGQEFLDRA